MKRIGKIEFDEDKYGSVITKDLTFSIQHYLDRVFPLSVIDLDHNRDGGWDENREVEFIEKLIKMGRFVGEIHLCDIDECLKNATDNETKIYFQIFKLKGFKYLCIDGNNRSITLLKFSTNGILSKEYLDRILNIDITVKIYYKIHKSIIAQEFLMINNGLQQSKQTTTNANHQSDFSRWIQTLQKKMGFLKYFISSKGLLVDKLDQQIAARIFIMADSHLNGLDVPSMLPDNIDDVYMEYNNKMPTKDVINLTEKIVDLLVEIFKSNKKRYKGQNYVINMALILIRNYHNQDINLDKLWNIYNEVHLSLYDDQSVNINGVILGARNDYKTAWSRNQHGGNVEKRYNTLIDIISKRESEFLEYELV